MKIQLTKKWKNIAHSRSSFAVCGVIYLKCDQCIGTKNRWIGSASIYPHKRVGSIRKSIKAARQDAQTMCMVGLLRDIRDGSKLLMARYGMGEDD